MSLTISYSKNCNHSNRKSFEKDWNSFLEIVESEDVGFFSVAQRTELNDSCQKVYEKFKGKNTFVQIGIGGSSLGPEMLISALGDGKRQFHFINNIDPDQLSSQLENLEPEKTLFYFVSKSGSTAEMTAGLIIIQQWLEQRGISQKQWPEHFVFATDPKESQLLDLGIELGITCLEIPSNVGGRFSVLTPVGLLPALFAGIDTPSLLAGATRYKEDLLSKEIENKEILSLAQLLIDQADQGRNQTVIMPYSSKLRDLAFWFVQLWAESLGKINKNGEHVGFTPIPGYGATDQHSQVQLFMEGPKDKVTIFIRIESFKHDFSLSNDLSGKSAKKLSPYSLSELMEAELQGTLKAMEEKDRPYILMSLSSLDAHNLGYILVLLESLTALVGIKLEIDPFNQPGVEAGKLYAFEWLQKLRK